MFVVKDLSVLKKYRFSNLKKTNEFGLPVFELLVERSETIVLKDSLLKDVLWKKDIVNTVCLTVNPFGAQEMHYNYNRNFVVLQESFRKSSRLTCRFIPMPKGRGFLGGMR